MYLSLHSENTGHHGQHSPFHILSEVQSLQATPVLVGLWRLFLKRLKHAGHLPACGRLLAYSRLVRVVPITPHSVTALRLAVDYNLDS